MTLVPSALTWKGGVENRHNDLVDSRPKGRNQTAGNDNEENYPIL